MTCAIHLVAAMATRRPRFLLLVCIVCVAYVSTSTAQTLTKEASDLSDAEYAASIQNWQAENERRLLRPDGWLALIAHVWLQQGSQTVGSRQQDAIRLPTSSGDTALATIRVEGNRVRFQAAENSGILVNGKWIPECEWFMDQGDLEIDCPDTITIGERYSLQLVRRNGKLAIRVRDRESRLIEEFDGKRWYPADRRYCVVAEFVAHETPRSIRIVNIRGEETSVAIVGRAVFELSGQQFSLDAMLEGPQELFFVFKDRTNGRGSYSPGRFLNCPVPKNGEKFELDFNRAYNPPCAFSPHTLCPLPPRQNHLAIEIPAGEMSPPVK